MAYRQTSIMDVWDIIRRWHDRQGVKEIARVTGFDRKTVKGYRRLAQAIGLSLEKPLPEKEEVLRKLLESAGRSKIGRSPRAQTLLAPYLEEIRGLINPSQKDLALKAKTAFYVLCERHQDLVGHVSYTSYKRFVHLEKLSLHPGLSTCRIEADAGTEVQIDYGKMCQIFDPEAGRRRFIYAFIGTLAHSRMKYVELTFRQDQRSFVCSHIRMFNFFRGVPSKDVIDNLKAGVISPSLYDPSLNKAYREMSEYYDCFIETARVAHPKDKGKVERDVQTVREAVRMLVVQNPGVSLAELNRLMIEWCLHTYGEREHGTTGEKPLTVFLERERPALKALPEVPFEVAVWKKATVHPDHYIQFCGKAYSVPHEYLGKTVWVRATEHILKVFYSHKLIKQHVITERYRHTDYEDFPENVRAALDTSYLHKKLLERAGAVGPAFYRIVHGLLSVHAYINLRTVQALVKIADGTADTRLIERAAGLIEQHAMRPTPQNFRGLLAKISAEISTPNLLPMSEATTEFIHPITYFQK